MKIFRDVKKFRFEYKLKIFVMNVEALSTIKGLKQAALFLIGRSMMIIDEAFYIFENFDLLLTFVDHMLDIF